MNTHGNIRALLVTAVLLILSFGIAVIVGNNYVRSLPAWRLSLETSHSGSILKVTTTKSEEPTYTVIIDGWRTNHPFSRLSRKETAAEREIRTVSWDDDVPPGDWTFVVAGTRIQAMPARLVINGSTECRPGETIILRIEK